MSEVKRTLEQMNEAQKKTINELTAEVKKLKQWEAFASYLINNCIGETVTPENLEKWLEKS